MAKCTFDKSFFAVVRGELKGAFPHLRIDFDIYDVEKRISGVTHCEVSGVSFSNPALIRLVPLNPFNNKSLSIYRIAVVSHHVLNAFKDIYLYVQQHSATTNFDTFINTLQYFEIAKNATLKRFIHKKDVHIVPKALLDYAFLLKDFDNVSTKEAVKNSIDNKNAVVLNNLNERSLLLSKPIYFSKRSKEVKLAHLKERSLNKGLNFNLTLENAEYLFNIRYCQLTGMLLTKRKPGLDLPHYYSIDRINRFEGYTLANSLVLCHEANQIKGKLERFNYTESIENLRYILSETKHRVLNKYQHDNTVCFDEQKAISIDEIIQHYTTLKQQQTHTRFIL